MPTKPETTLPALADPDQRPCADLVVIHLTIVLSATKGYRNTVRIQDGWQGATLSHWSRGGAHNEMCVGKAVGDVESALEEALGYVEVF